MKDCIIIIWHCHAISHAHHVNLDNNVELATVCVIDPAEVALVISGILKYECDRQMSVYSM